MILQPGLTELNRLPSRAPLIPLPADGVESPWRRSLDGVWRFQLVTAPAAAPQDWVTADTDAVTVAEGAEGEGKDGWRDINVPGVWTRQNTWDKPIYTNVRMPFTSPTEPGMVPDKNPTGLYRTDFLVDAQWAGRDLILHIGGFESVALVWCNGGFVGMGKDSRLPSEFDLTPYLVPGANQLAVMVIKWSDATWIEDQDHWRHGGIHRTVYLEARGKTRIDDIAVVADYEAATGQGMFSATCFIKGPSAGWAVRGWIEDAAGAVVVRLPACAVAQFPVGEGLLTEIKASFDYAGPVALLSVDLDAVQPWSSEMPTRYRLITELVDPSGGVTESCAMWTGFRRVEIRDRALLLNGHPIVIIGVNRHDHHPITGKSPTVEDMRADLVLMKQHNINAVRAAHYPNDHHLLDLADELGLYLLDEANVECHARAKAVSNNSLFQKAIIERTHRMILRDRNHVCIIGWSLGNESGHGPAHNGAAALARRLDPTRFVQYEGAVMDRFVTFWDDPTALSQNAPSASERATTDIICPMYPPIDFILNWARWAEETKLDDRPLIMCEYSHAMGNSNGSISDYVDAFYAEAALGGGFIWEWRDHGLSETAENGRPYWAYGGHFGEEQHDGNFCCDGLVGSDGTPHPGLIEYKWAARPIITELVSDKAVKVASRRNFRRSDDLVCHWSVQKNGLTVEAGLLDIILGPGAAETVTIPYTVKSSEVECHVTVEWRLKADTNWGRSGHLVGWDQLTISTASLNPTAPPIDATAATTCNLPSHIRWGETIVKLAKDGSVAGVELGGLSVIDGDVTACLWRAPIDNDGVKTMESIGLPNRRAEWIALGLDRLSQLRPNVRIEDGQLFIEREWRSESGEKAVHRSRWRQDDGGIRIDEEITIPEAWADMPRVGVRFEVPAGNETLTWFGLGPDESYSDRRKAQTVGVWHSTVADQFHEYALPQETGAHQDTRSFSLKKANGTGFEIILPRPISFSARHQHDADIDRSRTLADLVRRETIEVHIDAAMRGVGTGACGPDALPAYRVRPGVYAFSWVLKPASAQRQSSQSGAESRF